MSASASSSCRFSSANSRVRLDSGQSATYICHLKDLGLRSSARRTPLRRTESQGLLSTQGALYLCAINTNIRYLKRTSRLATKLLTASCSPLSADEIFSITLLHSWHCRNQSNNTSIKKP